MNKRVKKKLDKKANEIPLGHGVITGNDDGILHFYKAGTLVRVVKCDFEYGLVHCVAVEDGFQQTVRTTQIDMNLGGR